MKNEAIKFGINVFSAMIGIIIAIFILEATNNYNSKIKAEIRELELKVHELCGYSKGKQIKDIFGNEYNFICNDGRIVENAKECNKCKEGENHL